MHNGHDHNMQDEFVQDLIDSAKQGDEQAANELYKKYKIIINANDYSEVEEEETPVRKFPPARDFRMEKYLADLRAKYLPKNEEVKTENVAFDEYFKLEEKLTPIYRIHYKDPKTGEIRMIGNNKNNRFYTGAAAGTVISDLEYTGRFPKGSLIVKQDDPKEKAEPTPVAKPLKAPSTPNTSWMTKWENKNG